MAILTVTPGQSIQAAINAASSGDTINVSTGTYTDQFLTIQKSITLQAIGGEVVMQETQQPPNGKAMITEGLPGLSVTINGFDISGVSVPDSNGAAIRYEGGSLSLTDDYFHNNQEGLLGAADANGSITINHSEFAFNGDGSGSTHNIYVGAINSFTITNSYIHDAIVGHEIKSRAANNTISNNRIFDNSGSASYSIDLPNGGNSSITGNQIEQGPNTQNPAMIAYGEEGFTSTSNTIAITSNMLVNDDPSGTFILNPNNTSVGFSSNSSYGYTAAQLPNGLNNTLLATRPTLDLSPLVFGNTTPPPPPPTHGHSNHGHHTHMLIVNDHPNG